MNTAERMKFVPFAGLCSNKISMDDYHHGPGISKSGLDKVSQSPLHFWNAYVNPDAEPWEETPAQKLGSAIHCMVLEPEIFSSLYVIPPAINRRTNAGKAEWAEWESASKGKTLIDKDQMEVIQRATEAVRKHKLANAYLSGGSAEESFYWEDDETGQLCKFRPDYNKDDILCDLKTTADASYKSFARTCTNFRYHVSDSFSSFGYQKVKGVAAKAYKFVVVESKPPYGVAIYDLDQASKARGYELWRRNLDLFSQCSHQDDWPSYGESSQVLSLPNYAFYD